MVFVVRKESETTGALLRRFTRKMQMSGILVRARQNRFYKSKPTKRSVHERALRRISVARERTRLEKLGKLKKDER